MKILITEDDKITYNTLKQLLEAEGYQVSIVNTGEEAIEYVNRYPQDLIITDIMMPNMSGPELVKNYKGEVFNNTPIIVISSMDEYEINYFATAISAHAYFAKPFVAGELLKKVNDILGKEQYQ